jgi:hypothetical protein
MFAALFSANHAAFRGASYVSPIAPGEGVGRVVS